VGVSVGGGVAVTVGVGVPVGKGVALGGSGVSLGAGIAPCDGASVAAGTDGSPVSPAGAWQPEITRLPRRIIKKMDLAVFMRTLPANRLHCPPINNPFRFLYDLTKKC
jgi:hypothetical protein